jgi:NAD(P)H-dependent FMN reductase
VKVTVFEGLGELPFYNEDIDNADAPTVVHALRDAAAEADAALVVTPEYNGSIPGVLKNAIDWLSRPFGNSALKDKPMGVVGAAAGRYGGVWAQDETRKSFGIAGPRVVEAIKLAVPVHSLDGKHPRENAEVAANLREVLGKLAAEVG